jgi:hypothetical protein
VTVRVAIACGGGSMVPRTLVSSASRRCSRQRTESGPGRLDIHAPDPGSYSQGPRSAPVQPSRTACAFGPAPGPGRRPGTRAGPWDLPARPQVKKTGTGRPGEQSGRPPGDSGRPARAAHADDDAPGGPVPRCGGQPPGDGPGASPAAGLMPGDGRARGRCLCCLPLWAGCSPGRGR